MSNPPETTGLTESESNHACEHCGKSVRFGDTALSWSLEIICDDCSEKERDALNEEGITLP